MELQRQHFLLSYLKTLSVGPVGVSNLRPPASQPGAQPSEQPVRSSKPIALKAKRKCQRHPKGLTYLVWLFFKDLQFLLFVSDINFIEDTIRFCQWNVCYVTSFSFQITQGLSFSCWSILFTLVTHLLKGKHMNNVNQAQA